jgi:Amt family ammonium transporter
MLTASAMVQLMTPGLALFYGGLANEQATLSTIMLCFSTMGVVTVLWSLVGFSLAFAPNLAPNGIIGSNMYAPLDLVTINNVEYFNKETGSLWTPIPGGTSFAITTHTFAMFQLMFAIITSAIIAGSLVGKIKWSYFVLFTALWHLCVYCPLAHWIFYSGGWMAQYGVIDYAGGMVIHLSSGVASLVMAAWLNFTSPHPPKKHVPHNVPTVLIGAALLWFGWFGFNAGSALAANYSAGLAFTNTQLGAAAGMLTWNALEIVAGEKWFQGRPSAVGAATGAIVGLVGITPSAGFVAPMWALFIGFFTVLPAFPAGHLVKRFLGVDDCLDCFAIHGVGGAVGSALTGLFANAGISANVDQTSMPAQGSFYGQAILLGKQCAGISATVLYTVVATSVIFWVLWALAKALRDTIDLSPENRNFPDSSQHGETAYFKDKASAPSAAPVLSSVASA